VGDQQDAAGQVTSRALADLTVLDHDPFAVLPTELASVRADLTMVGSEVFFSLHGN
jgi:predicted amidohydrolase YtcJ